MSSSYRRRFDDLVVRIDGVPWMTPVQGWRIWEHFRESKPTHVLDVGTCYGTSAAYMAGAMRENGGTRVVSIDTGQFDERSDAKEWCRILWDRCGVSDLIEMVRISHSNYAWWLMEEAEKRTNEDGVTEPLYDFIYIDGGKLLTMDTAAVIFAEQLLRPGGWLLMDDLDWTYAEHPDLIFTVQYPDEVAYRLSEAEIARPHVRAVFDLVVKRHPAFDTFVEEDGSWGWARKGSVAERTVTIRTMEQAPHTRSASLFRGGRRWMAGGRKRDGRRTDDQ